MSTEFHEPRPAVIPQSRRNCTAPEIEAVPPCRILMAGGVPCEAIITERPRFDGEFARKDIQEPPKPVESDCAVCGSHRKNRRGGSMCERCYQRAHYLQRKDRPRRPKAQGSRVGRPRTRDPKPHPHAGRGKAWNHMDNIADEQIVAMREAGESYEAIGIGLGIHATTAFQRMKRWAARTGQPIPGRKWRAGRGGNGA